MKEGTDIDQRKADHIDLAFTSRIAQNDTRFYYEPLVTPHPFPGNKIPVDFLGKSLNYPIWVSSMTGGTKAARTINENLARMCGEFGFGMGLGSCRILLENPAMLPDFDVRKWIGPGYPLYANLGIAQVEKMISANTTAQIEDLIGLLQADGLIVHINPLQEWLQPGGDSFDISPLKTLVSLLEKVNFPVIAKEVGQGMGPESLQKLIELPLAAIELAAHGGTNFASLEMQRDKDPIRREVYGRLGDIGHSAVEMVGYLNEIIQKPGAQVQCKQVILSGGIRDFLDGFYLMKRLNLPAIYGQASGFLKHAKESYTQLQHFARLQTEGLSLAYSYLRVR
jgi:isopentenyl-diphosphate delta-isomerase